MVTQAIRKHSKLIAFNQLVQHVYRSDPADDYEHIQRKKEIN